MKNEEFEDKPCKRRSPVGYYLYDILDPFSKKLVKAKSYFKKNPFLYILFKLLFGKLTILLPLIIVCYNSYFFLTDDIPFNSEVPYNDILYNPIDNNINNSEYQINYNNISIYLNDDKNNSFNLRLNKTNKNNLVNTKDEKTYYCKNYKNMNYLNFSNAPNYSKNDKIFLKEKKKNTMKNDISNSTEEEQLNN
jgi:hypothetical protein